MKIATKTEKLTPREWHEKVANTLGFFEWERSPHFRQGIKKQQKVVWEPRKQRFIIGLAWDPKNAPESIKNTPKMLPKSPRRAPKDLPRAPKEPPKSSTERPRSPRSSQHGPQSAQGVSKVSLRRLLGPILAPFWPQNGGLGAHFDPNWTSTSDSWRLGPHCESFQRHLLRRGGPSSSVRSKNPRVVSTSALGTAPPKKQQGECEHRSNKKWSAGLAKRLQFTRYSRVFL